MNINYLYNKKKTQALTFYLLSDYHFIVNITGARGMELPPPFLTFCLHIYFQ